MKLPKIEYPIYEMKLISREAPVKFRPFLVKEQKLLMMAVESNSIETVISTMKQIINNCVVGEEIDVDSLSLIEIEQFYLNLRARSIGENIDIFFKCRNDVAEGTECGMVINVSIDLLKDVGIKNNISSNKIMFNNSVGVLMKYPSIEQLNILANDEEVLNKLIIDCLDKLFSEDEVFEAKDATQEELIDFLDSLSSIDYEKLEQFLSNAPKIAYEKEHKCPKCGFTHKILLEGLDDFFT